MAHSSDPQNSNRRRKPETSRLRLLPSARPVTQARPPALVPLLRPDEPVTPAQDALLTSMAQRARRADAAARDLLWLAFAARLEPAIVGCERMTWRAGWARRDGRPWELDDLRQEAWLVFADLIANWDGEGTVVPYVMAYFPWRLRNAMRRLGPQRRASIAARAGERFAECEELTDAEGEALLDQVMAALAPADAVVLQLRVMEGIGSSAIARRLGVSRRTVNRRWSRIRGVARETLRERGAPTG